jgi:hypothetical protein
MQNLKAKYSQRSNPTFGNLSTVVQKSIFRSANGLDSNARNVVLFKKKLLQMATRKITFGHLKRIPE